MKYIGIGIAFAGIALGLGLSFAFGGQPHPNSFGFVAGFAAVSYIFMAFCGV